MGSLEESDVGSRVGYSMGPVGVTTPKLKTLHLVKKVLGDSTETERGDEEERSNDGRTTPDGCGLVGEDNAVAKVSTVL